MLESGSGSHWGWGSCPPSGPFWRRPQPLLRLASRSSSVCVSVCLEHRPDLFSCNTPGLSSVFRPGSPPFLSSPRFCPWAAGAPVTATWCLIDPGSLELSRRQQAFCGLGCPGGTDGGADFSLAGASGAERRVPESSARPGACGGHPLPVTRPQRPSPVPTCGGPPGPSIVLPTSPEQTGAAPAPYTGTSRAVPSG